MRLIAVVAIALFFSTPERVPQPKAPMNRQRALSPARTANFDSKMMTHLSSAKETRVRRIGGRPMIAKPPFQFARMSRAVRTPLLRAWHISLVQTRKAQIFRLRRSHTEKVNGVKFTATEIDGVAMGNLIDGYVYRNFHEKKCYELDTRIAYSNTGFSAPGTVRNFDLEEVHRRLRKVLGSFEFLK
jgi:hypothetical protein